MSKIICSIALLLSCLGVHGQTVDSNSITVLVSRTATLPADQVQIRVSVNTGIDTDLNTLTTALTKAGVPAVTFTGVSSQSLSFGTMEVAIAPSLTWQFSFSVPYSKLHDQLTALQKSVQSLRSTAKLAMTFSLNGSTVSDAAVDDARRKLLPDLISDARKRATTLADAAGVTAGSVLGITEGAGITSAFIATGDFSSVLTASGSASPTFTVPYAITVKFQLLRYN